MKMKEPIIYHEITELGTTDYKVVISAAKEEDFPQYAVVHRRYGVIEFTNENLSFVRDWLSHFVTGNPESDKVEIVGDTPIVATKIKAN